LEFLFVKGLIERAPLYKLSFSAAMTTVFLEIAIRKTSNGHREFNPRRITFHHRESQGEQVGAHPHDLSIMSGFFHLTGSIHDDGGEIISPFPGPTSLLSFSLNDLWNLIMAALT
jgi:hypothetical protein